MVRRPPRAAVSRPVRVVEHGRNHHREEERGAEGERDVQQKPVESRSRATKEREGRATRSSVSAAATDFRQDSVNSPRQGVPVAARNGSEQLVDPKTVFAGSSR